MKELQKIIYKKDKDSINIGMELLVVKPLARDQSNKEPTKVVSNWFLVLLTSSKVRLLGSDDTHWAQNSSNQT